MSLPAGAPASAKKRDLISILDVAEDLPALLKRASGLRKLRHEGKLPRPLEGRSLAMIFEKPSTRTRSSFELAMVELGGHAVYLSTKDMQLGRGETIADTARVLSRYYHAVCYRAFRWQDEEELAKWASIPVINALDDREHPCQIVADLQTLWDRWRGKFEGRQLAYIGDGNNVLRSLMLGSAVVGLNFVAAIPPAYRPEAAVVEKAKALAQQHGSSVEIVDTPKAAARGSDAIYTDVWVSMGDEAEAAQRKEAFHGFQVNELLLGHANEGAFALHDLPAHRGEEITDGVMDGEQQAIWDQAENRLHAQKAILELLVAKAGAKPQARARRSK
ncbi:MAG: ornithine carbamoyltransferase [Euryarchaeota archaeon]|nr:ornithine carbamoyltransferase [Euryarchaeota archaeon]MDE1835474.1 ornithine carbamoyltransferase [Euryarchaeota archaeon]MDE1880367.1 ornithine carbamoyltransferase [Euryarchaeota archaeon]MDE2045755.1 ornithine carbamoyltransferase [Thermoplasmata archaeon]